MVYVGHFLFEVCQAALEGATVFVSLKSDALIMQASCLERVILTHVKQAPVNH